MDPTLSSELPHIYYSGVDKSGKSKESLSGDVNSDFIQNGRKFERSIFQNYGALKLANIDAVGKMTGHIKSVINPSVSDDEDDTFPYLDLCCGKGGFGEYILYRRKYSYGVGITLGNEGFTSGGHYARFRGMNNDGDILAYTDDLIKYFQRAYPPFRLVLADGVIDERPIGFKYSHDEEIDSVSEPNYNGHTTILEGYPHPDGYSQYDLIKTEMHIALKTLAIGGSFVVRLSNPLQWEEGKLVYNLSTFFDNIILMRPLTSEDGEVYLICREFNKKYENFPDLIMSKEFVKWFQEAGDLVKDLPEIKNHHYDRCLIRWGLPSGNMQIKRSLPDEKKALQLFNMWIDRPQDIEKLYEHLNKPLTNKPWEDEMYDIEVSLENHTYNIITRRGTNAKIVKSRVDSYLEKVFGNWDEVCNVIDWYAPYGFVGFKKLENSQYLEGLTNPFARSGREWAGLFGENGSLGKWEDHFNNGRTWQIYLPPSKGLIDYFTRVASQNKGASAIVYLPKWQNLPVFELFKSWKDIDVSFYDYGTGKPYKNPIKYVRAKL